MHQGHEKFKGSGRQCVANAVTAIIQSSKVKPKLWNTKFLDFILATGDDLYMTLENHGVKYLTHQDLPDSIATLCPSFNGMVDGKTEGLLYSLYDALQCALNNETACLFTMGRHVPFYTTAIMHCDGQYFFFDSHSRGCNGLSCPDGKACLSSFIDLKTLCCFIQDLAKSLLLDQSCLFEATPFKPVFKTDSCSDSESKSESDFSGFDSMSEGEYACRMFIAEELVTKAINASPSLSEVSSVSDLDNFSDLDSSIIENGIADTENSFSFLQNIDENVFDQLHHSNNPVDSSDSDKEVDTGESDNADDSDYHPCQVSTSESDSDSDNIPLACYVRQKDARAPLSVITNQGENIEKEKNKSTEVNLCTDETSRCRKRKKNFEKWKRTVSKRRCNSGLNYIDKFGNEKSPRKLKRTCGPTCRYKCSFNFKESEREKIFHYFWQLGEITKQRQFLQMFANRETKKQISVENSRRQFSIKWTLPQNPNIHTQPAIRVCKTFFLNTLGISDKMVSTTFKKTMFGVCEDDKTGLYKNRPNKTPETQLKIVREHISTLEKVTSHYCRKDTKKEYLPANLNQAKLYRLYCEYCIGLNSMPVSKYIYTDIFNNEFNLAFHKPLKDQCDVCVSFDNACQEEKVKMKAMFESHLRNKELARLNKSKDKEMAKKNIDKDVVVCCFDLEEVLLTPHSFESCLYYSRRLNTYNFTIYDMGSADGHCFVWNEAMAGRGACEIATCLLIFFETMSKKGKKKFICYSDNCASQNKNRFFLTMLWYCLQKFKLSSITQKYMEKGHTQNEGDAIHATIENASKNVKIYTTSQWASVMRSARPKRPYIVHELSHADFYDFKNLAQLIKNFDNNSENTKVYWQKIKVLTLTAEFPNQYQYQTDYDGKVFVVDLFEKLRLRDIPLPTRINLQPLNKGDSHQVSKDKYHDLLKLCQKQIIPRVHHSFYLLLPHE